MAAKDALKSLKATELKEQCRSFGLKVSGTKQELIDRLKLYYRRQANAEKKLQKAQNQRDAVKADSRPCKKSKPDQHDEPVANSSLAQSSVAENAGAAATTSPSSADPAPASHEVDSTMAEPLQVHAQPESVGAVEAAEVAVCAGISDENSSSASRCVAEDVVPAPMVRPCGSDMHQPMNCDTDSCEPHVGTEATIADPLRPAVHQEAMVQTSVVVAEEVHVRSESQTGQESEATPRCQQLVDAVVPPQEMCDLKASLEKPANTELPECQEDASSTQAQTESVRDLTCPGEVSATAQHAPEAVQVAMDQGSVEGIQKEAIDEEEEEVIEMPAAVSNETDRCQKSYNAESSSNTQDANNSTVVPTVQAKAFDALPPLATSLNGHSSSKTDGTSSVQTDVPKLAVPSWASESPASRPIFLDRTYARLLAKQAARASGEDLSASWTPSRKTTSAAQSPPPPLASPTPARAFATISSPVASKSFTMTLSPLRQSPAIKAHEKATFSLTGASPMATRLQDGKQRVLKQLTDQMQVCLSKMSSHDLDRRTREKYQDMANSIKSQMDKLNDLPKTAQSPARACYSPHACLSPLSVRGGGC